ncbi:hypothetical protein NL676_011682 [Syzygium grande]|nr:hypothetical protein NL676_011682 [Syzygium grande]
MIRGLPRAANQGRRPLHEQVLGGHGAPTATRQRPPRHRNRHAWARATLSRRRLGLCCSHHPVRASSWGLEIYSRSNGADSSISNRRSSHGLAHSPSLSRSPVANGFGSAHDLEVRSRLSLVVGEICWEFDCGAVASAHCVSSVMFDFWASGRTACHRAIQSIISQERGIIAKLVSPMLITSLRLRGVCGVFEKIIVRAALALLVGMYGRPPCFLCVPRPFEQVDFGFCDFFILMV